MARATLSGGKPVGEIVRYVPAPESAHAAVAILILTVVEMTFVALFGWFLFAAGGTPQAQQAAGVWLGAAILTLAAILSLYRKFFVPDVLQVKLRKLKYEDLR